jgi:MFS family permease
MAALPSVVRVAPAEEGLLRPRTKIAALIGGALLLISVFLPWMAASEKVGKELGSASGMRISMIIGAAGIIGGLVAIGSAFFPSAKARSAVQIVMAVLALAALPAIVFMGILPLLSEYARSLFVLKEGLYLYAIAAVLLIIVGSLERRHW